MTYNASCQVCNRRLVAATAAASAAAEECRSRSPVAPGGWRSSRGQTEKKHITNNHYAIDALRKLQSRNICPQRCVLKTRRTVAVIVNDKEKMLKADGRRFTVVVSDVVPPRQANIKHRGRAARMPRARCNVFSPAVLWHRLEDGRQPHTACFWKILDGGTRRHKPIRAHA